MLPATTEGPAGTRLRRAPATGQAVASAAFRAGAGDDTETDTDADTPRDTEGAQPGGRALPGRHAARRRRAPTDGPAARLGDAAPDAVRPAVRWALAPGHLRVIVLLVVLALLVSGWWLLRSRPEALPGEVGLTLTPPGSTARAGEAGRADDASRGSAPAAATTSSDPSTDGAGSAAGEVGEVIVHVAGRVRRPGIVRLPTGARVVDALEAAGGARRGVALRGVNLARALVDGEQVLVGPPGVGPAPAPAPGAPLPDAPVNLNTADQSLLETLPGVGPVTAGKILAWREEVGRFTAVEELLEVDGIGEATLAELTPLVTV